MFDLQYYVRMIKKKQTAKELLKAAKSAPSKAPLAEHLDTILTLREKSYSWRDIAAFLNEHGVVTEHSKIFRFINKQRSTKMDSYKNFFIPTSNQYINALKDIEGNITEKQKEMLGFHFKAHNRTATFSELASAVEYTNYNAANLQYGLFGRTLGEKLEMVFVPMGGGNDGELFLCSSIGADSVYKQQESDYQLVMHHELAKALAELKWFE